MVATVCPVQRVSDLAKDRDLADGGSGARHERGHFAVAQGLPVDVDAVDASYVDGARLEGIGKGHLAHDRDHLRRLDVDRGAFVQAK